MKLCKDCKHYEPITSKSAWMTYWTGYGHCDRWKAGYRAERSDVASNEVLVENDEGWGAIMGPEFGCVLHEPR